MENKIIDLHTHTNYSDGEYSPDELINLAIKEGISLLAITDHDSIMGIQSVDKSKYNDIKIINGIEFTVKVEKGRMHILGLDIDIQNKELNDIMSELRDNSVNSVLSVMEQIKRDYGIRFKYEDIRDLINANHNIGRPDLAKLCIKYGYATSVKDAFNKYLVEAYDKTRFARKGLTYKEVFDYINNAGGYPVLAHPKSLELSNEELTLLIEDMVKCGLKGIEVYHSSHNEEEKAFYMSLAEKYNLLVSGGSDYHGPLVKPDIKLGIGLHNNVNLDDISIVKSFK